MSDKNGLILAIYLDRNTYARHCDELQVKITNILIIICAGILAFISNNGLTKDKWPLALFLFILGLFGILVSLKLYERIRFYLTAAKEYRKELESLFETDLDVLHQRIEVEHQRRFPILYKRVIVLTYWVMLHSLIAILGLFLFGYLLLK